MRSSTRNRDQFSILRTLLIDVGEQPIGGRGSKVDAGGQRLVDPDGRRRGTGSGAVRQRHPPLVDGLVVVGHSQESLL